ncbi:carbon starvation CstA family protein [Oceanirhabdus sp. W0125-5]|uniref:carbon starvation CstA family protein n=1 Tax=Oceanirhabdus sp. W0125-5 TaxID=2999116 RepID=UPI0022F2C942|nr:carbon starvation protein A [Oceanirhabdus sp. W0125-5]WBW98271.1 carbon starvation protein A [Oceanirhabdus sp. W0125-5]
MSSLTLIIGVCIIFFIAYITYGSWLCKKWGIDPKRKTPAHTMNDGVDYVPAKSPVLLGHHFSSIAGAGPITGPIAAAAFGWIPVMLWIIIGSIFFGGVHDMGAVYASVRNKGKSIGEVIHANMGDMGKKLFSWFAWLTLLLVVAAFTSICAGLFASTPSVATASALFMVIAVLFGFFVYRKGAPLLLSSIIGVALLALCIWVGMSFPVLEFSKNTWIVILLIYITIASVAPVWILLQPRDYLNSFLLYAMLAGGIVGLIFTRPELKLDGFTGFNLGNGKLLFPILFVTVACGAISGFHSLVGSGTSSKQVNSEKDIKMIGYGSMLIEGVLATLAIITAAYLTKGELAQTGNALAVFSNGLGNFMAGFGLKFELGRDFTALAISAFALTSLDTATRLGRFIFQEMFSFKNEKIQKTISNKYVATVITVVLGGLLAYKGWLTIWPIFGAANQLLAALALLALAVFLRNMGKEHRMALIPTVFMFIVTQCALVVLILQKLNVFSKDFTGSLMMEGLKGNWLLLLIAIVLFVLAFILMGSGVKALRSKPKVNVEA